MFLFRKRFWLTVAKVAALAFVAMLVVTQLPELSYDLGSTTPVEIRGPDDLTAHRFTGPTFVSVHGSVDFEKAVVLPTHGLTSTYFLLEPYGNRLVVRTFEPVGSEEAWRKINRFLGRLKPLEDMPFDRTVRHGFRETVGVEIPDGAFFLAKDDVPRLSGWQVGATAFAVTLWAVLFYVFFVRRWKFSLSPGGREAR
jgi:hypothetical protein